MNLIILASCGLFVLLAVLIVRGTRRGGRVDIFGIVPQFMIWLSFFALPLPLLRGFGKPVPYDILRADDNVVASAVLLLVVSLGAFWGGHVVAGKSLRAPPGFAEVQLSVSALRHSLTTLIALVVAAGTGLVITLGGPRAFITTGYHIYQSLDGIGHYAVSLDWAAVTIILAFALYRNSRKSPIKIATVLLMGALTTFLLMVSSRRLLLFAMIGAGAILHYPRRRFSVSQVIVVLIGGFILLTPISYLRAEPLTTWAEPGVVEGALHQSMANFFDPSRGLGESTDIFASLPNTMALVGSGEQPLLLGQTYVSAPQVWIPKIISSERPLTASQWYVAKMDPVSAEAGGGRGFFVASEAFLNFSYGGVIVQFFIIGLIVSLVQTWLHDGLGRGGNVVMTALILAWLPSALRIDFAVGSKAFLMTVAFPAGVYAVFRLMEPASTPSGSLRARAKWGRQSTRNSLTNTRGEF